MKKTLALALTAVMALSLLAACGGTGSSTTPAPSAAASTAASSAASASTPKTSGTVLKVWIPPYAGGDAEYTDLDFWNDQFADFETENNCTVEVSVFPWSGYMQKITTGFTSGDGPDVVYIDTLYDLAASGMLEPLDGYFTQEEKDNYYYYDMGQVAGDQYVLPMMVGDATVLFCNMDILKEAGFDTPPTTWEELVTYSKKIEETNPDIYSFIQPWGNSSGKSTMMTSFLPYFWQAGGEFLDAEGKPNLNSPEGLATIEFLQSLMDEGIFDETIVSLGDAPDTFRSGEAAMVMLGTGMAASIEDAGINWDYSTLKGPSGHEAFWISGDALAVAANSPNKELAVEAIKYMTSAKVMDAFHETLYAMPSLTHDATFTEENDRFKDLYENEEFIANFHVWPAFENADSFYDILFKNIQSMYMGDLTPQQVIDNSLEEYSAAL